MRESIDGSHRSCGPCCGLESRPVSREPQLEFRLGALVLAGRLRCWVYRNAGIPDGHHARRCGLSLYDRIGLTDIHCDSGSPGGLVALAQTEESYLGGISGLSGDEPVGVSRYAASVAAFLEALGVQTESASPPEGGESITPAKSALLASMQTRLLALARETDW